MPTDQIVALLLAERDKLSRAIDALQGPTKRRGRPPKNAAVAAAAAKPAAAPLKRKRRSMSAAQRKAQGERMKKYWAAKRKATAKKP